MIMRPPLLTIIPLFLAVIALILASGTSGYLLPLTAVLAAVTVLVVLGIISQYMKPPAEVKQVPIENFYLWADIGESGAELRRLSPGDVEAATRIASADLGSLSSNADLLNSRISLLLGRDGFEELTQEKFNGQTEKLSEDLRGITKQLKKGFQAEILSSIEQCASQADRIANKLYDFQRGKSEVVHVYVEPLRRAAEKLSSDLRLAFTNISNFVKSASAGDESS
ncbi:MAG: hypothetical protein E3J91_00235 [Hadesarchaea archaeon]|nr:MAG: hypothetical protein E3J91_00235 [Hadesarchaea archaeon]